MIVPILERPVFPLNQWSVEGRHAKSVFRGGSPWLLCFWCELPDRVIERAERLVCDDRLFSAAGAGLSAVRRDVPNGEAVMNNPESEERQE